MPDRLEWESLLTSVAHELPQPVAEETVRDGSVVLVGGDPPEIVVRLTRSTASVSEYAVAWNGSDEAIVRPVLLGSIKWHHLPEVQAIACLNALIRAGRDSRRSKYRTCQLCERLTPPENMFDDGVCAECR